MVSDEPRTGSSGGFTLIELLSVIIIVGVLAAIAIPSFLRHRDRGGDVAVASDLRNAAIAQDAYLTDGEHQRLRHHDRPTGGTRASGRRQPMSYYGGVFAMTIGGTDAEGLLHDRALASGRYLGYSASGGRWSMPRRSTRDTCASRRRQAAGLHRRRSASRRLRRTSVGQQSRVPRRCPPLRVGCFVGRARTPIHAVQRTTPVGPYG